MSWGGFTKTARQEARRLFFEIRLWGSDAVIDKLEELYAGYPPMSRPTYHYSESGRFSPTRRRHSASQPGGQHVI